MMEQSNAYRKALHLSEENILKLEEMQIDCNQLNGTKEEAKEHKLETGFLLLECHNEVFELIVENIPGFAKDSKWRHVVICE
jgi:hypothetical protein